MVVTFIGAGRKRGRIHGFSRRWALPFAASAMVMLAGTQASALSISLSEIRSGRTFPIVGGKATAKPKASAGKGTMAKVMRMAETSWEKAIRDSDKVKIYYGWGKQSKNVLASATISGNRGTIIFNNANRNWFIDGTPYKNEEFGKIKKKYARIDGKRMTTGRYGYARKNGPARNRYDLATVALHEVGHSIGAKFHINPKIENLDQALLVPSLSRSMFREISTLDAYATADFAGYDDGYRTYNILATPLPATLPLAATAFGALGVFASVGRNRKKRSLAPDA